MASIHADLTGEELRTGSAKQSQQGIEPHGRERTKSVATAARVTAEHNRVLKIVELNEREVFCLSKSGAGSEKNISEVRRVPYVY